MNNKDNYYKKVMNPLMCDHKIAPKILDVLKEHFKMEQKWWIVKEKENEDMPHMQKENKEG